MDTNACAALFKQEEIEVVFHLAATVDAQRHSGFDSGQFIDNLRMAKGVAEGARKSDVGNIIVAGSSEEYGKNPAPFSESTREMPVSPYSASKVAATHWLQMMHRVNGLPVTIARPFLTYGPGDKSNRLVPSLVRTCLANGAFEMTDGKQTREFNFVEDMVAMFVRLAEIGGAPGRVVNFGNGLEIPIHAVAEEVVKQVGSGTIHLGAIPRREGEASSFFADTSLVRSLIGPLPVTSLPEGIRRTIVAARA